MSRALLTLLTFIILTPAHADNQINIFTPDDKSRGTNQTVWLVMSTKTNPENIPVILQNKGSKKKIQINGKKVIRKGGSFVVHTLLYLEEGLNKVIIGSKAISIFYTPRYRSPKSASAKNKALQNKYSPYLFHTEGKEVLCLKCHKIDRSQSDCLKCHKEVAASEYLHGPLGSGECLACHDPESVPSKFTARFGGEGELCFGCHQESKNKYSNNRFLHGPVGVNQCTVCHNPHSSSFKYQLVAAERDICYLCHDKKRIVGKRIVHKPVKRRGCVFCHDPHSSNHTSHLLQAEQTLCADPRCHPKFAKITINHPIKGHPVSGKQDPLQPERELSCRSCHNPHSADFPFLFPAEQYLFCAKCHRY